ncbi:MAG: hypothetical protein JSV74_01515 [Dehalococcoidia bacterium]|nr:MAG: hypothetical protein JSV74_01515 [Dehalococcoidia bacterium]
MKRKNILFFFALALILTFIAIPGCSSNTESSVPSNQENNSTSGGLGEGIEVHGHWTIEVRNPDGSLEGSYEFENELIGNERLAEFLAREYSVGAWMLGAGYHIAGEGPWYDPATPSQNEDCKIVEAGSGFTPNPWVFENLTVSTNNSIVLTLNGMAIAQRDGTINVVRTYVARLAATLPPAIDPGMGYFPFTQTVITEISVNEGQYVVFTVVMSFS